jgi:hypothetical protein
MGKGACFRATTVTGRQRCNWVPPSKLQTSHSPPRQRSALLTTHTPIWGLHTAQGEAEGPLAPLSVGVETIPVGVAYVFQSDMPDLFVVNNKLSTEPGLYLYEWLRTVRDRRLLTRTSSECSSLTSLMHIIRAPKRFTPPRSWIRRMRRMRLCGARTSWA